MNSLRYTVGFIAGMLDGLGMIRARNAILRTVAYTGRTMDGFDAGVEIVPR